MKNVRPGSKITIDATKTSYIATDILELIEDFANVHAREENIKVKLSGFKTSYRGYESDRHSHVSIRHRRAI